MALEKDLQDYLKSRKDVQEARKKLQEAKSKASQLSSASKSAPQNAKGSVEKELAQANIDLTAANSEFTKIESEAKSYYRDNKESIQTDISKGKVTKATTNLEDAKRTRDALAKAGQSTTLLDKKIIELEGNIAGGFQEVPKSGTTVSGQPNTNQIGKIEPENFDELAKTARDFVKNTLKPAERLLLAKQLDAAGIPNVPITGEYTDALATAYKNAIGSAKSAWNAFGEYPTVAEFLNEQARQANVLKTAGGGGTTLPEATGVQQIYDKSTAEGTIDSLFQSFLKRDASQSEIDSLYKQLDAEQKKASSISTSKYKMVNGVKVRVDQINFDPKVFLENQIKQLPTYKNSLAAKAEQNKLSLAATALANGYNLESDFGTQLPTWLDAINKGENISKFQSTIRNSARLALPEAVRNSLDPTEDLTTSFATYISNYAKTFGVPANQVSLSKIIPLATNEKGFVPIYDFEKKKRQLPEWDTTPDARTETANVVSTVLKDFGFKG
jgi:hypothetical protein